MVPVSLIITVAVTYICFANGQSKCKLPDGGIGLCQPASKCPATLNMFTKQHKTQEDRELLEKLKCKGVGQDGVCCGLSRRRRYATTISRQPNCADTVSAFPPDPSTQCCGVDSFIGNKITGGTATAVDQYPWLVIIEYLKMGKFKLMCGGALISGRYVLTAAHCVVGEVLDHGTPKNVRLGEYDTKNSGPDCALVEAGGEDCTDGIVTVPIEKIIPHPGYDASSLTSPNDIALIRLSQPAQYTDFIRPICLPTVDVTLSPPENFTTFAAGWGAVSRTQLKSNLKLHVDLPYVKKDVCEPAYRSGGVNVRFTSGQLCAGGIAGKDSCKGDSGGPLMYENERIFEIIGVVSYGPKNCGQANVPGVYTKVHEYLDWIRDNIVA